MDKISIETAQTRAQRILQLLRDREDFEDAIAGLSDEKANHQVLLVRPAGCGPVLSFPLPMSVKPELTRHYNKAIQAIDQEIDQLFNITHGQPL